MLILCFHKLIIFVDIVTVTRYNIKAKQIHAQKTRT